MNITDRSSVGETFAQAKNQFGIVNTVINNAEVAYIKRFQNIDQKLLDFVMDTDFESIWTAASRLSSVW